MGLAMDPALAREAYPCSLEHLLEELERLNLLIRLQVWRARQRASDDEGLRAVYIAEDEPDELLDRIVGTPGWAVTSLPSDLLDAAQTRLDALQEVISRRTAASLQTGVPLRLLALADLFGSTTLTSTWCWPAWRRSWIAATAACTATFTTTSPASSRRSSWSSIFCAPICGPRSTPVPASVRLHRCAPTSSSSLASPSSSSRA